MSESSDGKLHLAVYDRAGSLRKDGVRVFVHPADVRGRWLTLRRVGFALLITLWAALPSITIGGRPAVFLDVPARRFFLFGTSFDASSVWLVWFLLMSVLFGLVVTTTSLGRVWCGWACPQTVFLEGFFRPIERFFDGDRQARIRLAAAPWTAGKVVRRVLKHLAFLLVAFFVSHLFVAYFVSLPSLVAMMTRSPVEHPHAFAWCVGVGLILYGNFAWFREQLCLVICPYGRLQSVLLDDDSLTVGYDERRGEPRGRGKRVEGDARGDCVDCGRCVVVCPTGIDIRNGLQVDCIACAQCIDACDDVMTKLGKPRGLVRYDSLRGLRGEKRRFWRPRVIFYAALSPLFLGAVGFALTRHASVEARLLRLRGAPFVNEGALVRNGYEVHVVNDDDDVRSYRIEAWLEGGEGAMTLGQQPAGATTELGQGATSRAEPLQLEVTVDGWEEAHVPLFVRVARDTPLEPLRVHVQVRAVGSQDGDEGRALEAAVLGPRRRAGAAGGP